MRPAHGGLTGMGGFTGMVAFDGNGFLELGKNTDFALCEGCGWFEESIRFTIFPSGVALFHYLFLSTQGHST